MWVGFLWASDDDDDDGDDDMSQTRVRLAHHILAATHPMDWTPTGFQWPSDDDDDDDDGDDDDDDDGDEDMMICPKPTCTLRTRF